MSNTMYKQPCASAEKRMARANMLISYCSVAAVMVLMSGGAAGAEPVRIAGITAPVNEATLSSIFPGQIHTIHVEEGSTIEEGGLLIELDKRSETLDAERRKIISESKAEVNAAGQRMLLLQNEWETARQLYETTKSISQEERDRKKLEYELAKAEHDRLNTIELQEELEYKLAVEQLNRRDIRSPIRGTVTRIYLQEGEGCDPRQPLIEVVDASACEFICNVPENLTSKLQSGATVRLQIESGETLVDRTGAIVFISPVVDPASGLREVKAEFDNTDGSVSPGVHGFLLLDAQL